MATTYDYIITGGGAAGRSLLCHLLQSPLRGKSILLIDREHKQENDRTWCFWEKEPGFFEDIVFHSWDQLWVHTGGMSRLMPIAPYTYKLIRGIDFYRFTDEMIDRLPNVERLYAPVEQIDNTPNGVLVRAGGQEFRAAWCFNSIFFGNIDKEQVHYLDQHFRGWFIQTQQPVFDPGQATLMDFRLPQLEETRFLYVLPYSPTEALVEVAIFSNQHLSCEAYDDILRQYIQTHLPQAGGYTIQQAESGNIPMTDHDFRRMDGRIVHLGMAGGDTRASSGYTFFNIQRRSARLVQQLTLSGAPAASEPRARQRARFYDHLFLRVLEKGYYPGDELFGRLFSRNRSSQVLSFLNAETTLLQELRLTASLPKWPFLRALFGSVASK